MPKIGLEPTRGVVTPLGPEARAKIPHKLNQLLDSRFRR